MKSSLKKRAGNKGPEPGYGECIYARRHAVWNIDISMRHGERFYPCFFMRKHVADTICELHVGNRRTVMGRSTGNHRCIRQCV